MSGRDAEARDRQKYPRRAVPPLTPALLARLERLKARQRALRRFTFHAAAVLAESGGMDGDAFVRKIEAETKDTEQEKD